MSNVYTLPRNGDIWDQASDWLAKLDRGLTGQEEIALQEWLTETPANRKTLLKMAEMWDMMDSLSRLTDLFPQPIQGKKRTYHAPMALAATVLVAVFVSVWATLIWNQRSTTVENSGVAHSIGEQHFNTGTGEKSTIVLADGSRLILNTNSLVKARFTPDQRAIYLERGEVHVQVEKDKQRPFNVFVGQRVIQAVGTEFNLEITDTQKIELIVTEGKVIVAVQPISADLSVPQTRANVLPVIKEISHTLEAGQKVVLGDQEELEEVQQITLEEIKVKLSWRGGNLIFRGESLEQAINEIERYTPVEFEILDENLKQIRVAGLFKAGDVDGLLNTLEKNFNVTYERIGSEKVVLSRMEEKTH